jgi:hypothetical protein
LRGHKNKHQLELMLQLKIKMNTYVKVKHVSATVAETGILTLEEWERCKQRMWQMKAGTFTIPKEAHLI